MNDVVIIRSKKRKSSIEAKIVKEKLFIYLPITVNNVEEKKWIEKMTKWSQNYQKKKELNSSNLLKRAEELNKKYFKGTLDFSIKFVTNQNTRFGSCTFSTKTIRISDKIAKMPRWVQDYVIIHELTHIIHPNHTKKFWEKVKEYKYTERARGYLIAVGLNPDKE
jgi:predicted metal-dependent hydrolase